MAQIPWKTPPTIEELKEQKIQQVKQQAYDLLKETDWYVARQQETGKEIPADVANMRISIRQKSNVMEQEIEELETTEDVQSYTINYE